MPVPGEPRPSVLAVSRARERLCYMDDGRPPATDADAAALVSERRFMLLGVTSRSGLPNLSAADPGREWAVGPRAWRWKETLPAAGACAYLKWFGNQGTFISWDIYPAFFALWGPRQATTDLIYRAGLLSRSELAVLAVIEERGPVSSRELWRELRFRFGGRRPVMLAALARLQRSLLVTVAGGELAGWSMHHWDLVSRCVPERLLSRLPTPSEAQDQLVLAAVDNLVLAGPREVASLFGWLSETVMSSARRWASQGRIRLGSDGEAKRGTWLASVVHTV